MKNFAMQSNRTIWHMCINSSDQVIYTNNIYTNKYTSTCIRVGMFVYDMCIVECTVLIDICMYVYMYRSRYVCIYLYLFMNVGIYICLYVLLLFSELCLCMYEPCKCVTSIKSF